MDDGIIYICSDVYFDSADYSAITIHKGVTISREVLFLVHDLTCIGWIPPKGKTAHFIKPIVVGENSFIGARAVLLGGTNIEKNCIIGANACIKGKIPDYSIVIGNPARIIGDTREWAKQKLEMRDWVL